MPQEARWFAHLRIARPPAHSQPLHTVSEIFTPTNGAEIGDPRPALVLDTNTVLALWMFRDPALDALRDWIEAGNCRLYSREDALEELRRVLGYRQFGLDEEEQARLHAEYCARLTPMPVATDAAPLPDSPAIPRCRDTDDQKFVELIYESGADLLLTRDKALLRLRRPVETKTGCRIVPPDILAAELRAPN